MRLTREQRVLNTIKRKPVDFLPSDITFAEVSRMSALARELGLKDEAELKQYMDNHIEFLTLGIDTPITYRNDVPKMRSLVDMGLAGLDLERGVVYDGWGVGIKMHIDGFFPCYHPLQPGSEKDAAAHAHIPQSFNKKALDCGGDIVRAMAEFYAPDALSENNWRGVGEALGQNDGSTLKMVSGYGGLFERAYHVLGFEELMLYMALYPNELEAFLDKITQHKVCIAQRAVELGVKVGHIGDDLGTQLGLIFSKEMFRKFYKPRYKQIFEVYHKADIPIQMHSCGNIMEIIPDLIDIGLTVLEPVQPCMDLARLKREFGSDLVFYGGIDTQLCLPYAKPDEVKKLVCDTIHTLGKGGGYIISPAQTITEDVPVENIRALIETILVERVRVLE